MSYNGAMWGALQGLREEDARIELGLRGLRESDADISLSGLREDDAMISLSGLREDDADISLNGLREDDADISLNGLREDDAMISLGGLREEDAAISLNGLREDDAMIQLQGRYPGLGRAVLGKFEVGEAIQVGSHMMIRPIKSPVVYRAESAAERAARGRIPYYGRWGRGGMPSPIKMLHPVKIQGTGQVAGLFDFLTPTWSSETYLGKLRLISQRWATVRARLDRLSQQTQTAVHNNMMAANASYEDYTNTVPIYIADGYAGLQTHSGRQKRVARWEAYIPTVEKLVADAELFGPGPSPAQEQKQVNQTAITDVVQRQEAAVKESALISTVLPVAAGAGALGLLYVIVRAVSR